eukprot:462212-Rhodomonas_salina.1
MAEAQARIWEAERALVRAQAETLDAEREFGEVFEEILSEPSFYFDPPAQPPGAGGQQQA